MTVEFSTVWLWLNSFLREQNSHLPSWSCDGLFQHYKGREWEKREWEREGGEKDGESESEREKRKKGRKEEKKSKRKRKRAKQNTWSILSFVGQTWLPSSNSSFHWIHALPQQKKNLTNHTGNVITDFVWETDDSGLNYIWGCLCRFAYSGGFLCAGEEETRFLIKLNNVNAEKRPKKELEPRCFLFLENTQ